MGKRISPGENGWRQGFLAALAEGLTVRDAAARAGVGLSTPYRRKAGDPGFRAEWEAIRPAHRKPAATTPPSNRREYLQRIAPRHDDEWHTPFLARLSETSNVSAAADEAQVSPEQAYRTRREDPGFAAGWRAALAEGYDHLELEVLASLRAGTGAREHPIDVPNAIRLLAAHRKTALEMRALEEGAEDERAARRTIEAMVARLRQDEGLPAIESRPDLRPVT